MKMTLASFVFKDQNKSVYRADFYPEGKSAYKVALTKDNVCHAEQQVSGRQVLSKWNAKRLLTQIFKNGETKTE